MTPSEFWRATPHEVLLWINGRTDAEFELAAWHASNVMAALCSPAPTPDKLLGRERDESDVLRIEDFPSVEAFVAAVEERKARHDPLEDDDEP